MVNKKGFIRTLEAVIAVVVVLTFIYVVILKAETPTGEVPFNIRDTQKFIFEEIALNDAHRNCIVSSSSGPCLCTGINQLIEGNKPAGYNYACEICNKAQSCANLDIPLDKSVYTDSIFIGKDKFKILRVYFWEA